jgi:NAD(P)-dependent dehydrogenase (short-subunit alcohol dehydrogenase family)
MTEAPRPPSASAPALFGDLLGKTALVTGASGGLGAHFAAVLAGAGAEVILAARREEALRSVGAAITAAGGRCSTLRLDVSDPASIRSADAALLRVDILVNNAGVGTKGSALDQTEADWDMVIDTNLKGMFLLAQAAARAMRARDADGSIINVSSILGLRQAGGVVPYAVSKAGAIQLTKALALEWARYGVRVNALAPGYFDNEVNAELWDSEFGKAMLKRIPQRRPGRLQDLDGPLLLLASDASAYMTGTVLTVDGGHLVSSL